MRLTALDTATSIEDMHLSGFRLHPLKGDRKGLWAVDVSKNWRIIFKFQDGNVYVVRGSNLMTSVIFDPDGHI